jgi:zinc transport system substrate-binding protein
MIAAVRRLLALSLVVGAAGASPQTEARIRIIATVLPLRDFAAAVAGERGEASLLLPPGAEVHAWQPRPRDIARLSECDLLLHIGAGLEPWLPGLLRAFPKGGIRTLEAAAGLADTGLPGEALDPHVWLDFELDVLIVRRLAEELTRIAPEGGPEFAANAKRLIGRLVALDAAFREGLAGCRSRDIVLAGHSAFGHLASRYGLVQRALYGLSPDARPKPKDLMAAIDFCRANDIRTVFSENAVPPDLAVTLAREIGGRVLVLHTGHNLTRDEQARGLGFFDLMEENLAALRDGLGCR